MWKTIMRGFVVGLLVVAGAGLAAAQTGTSPQAVAFSFTNSPAGVTYNSFGSNPVINNAGQVAFIATLGQVYPSGIFAGTPGALQTVALETNSAPAGGRYSFFNSPTINASGQVAFSASLINGTSASGVFTGTPGTTLTTAALQGTAAPAGGNYSGFSLFPVLNNAGLVAFQASLTGGSSTSGLFSGTPGTTLTASALQGTASPGGGFYAGPDVQPMFNAGGTMAFGSATSGNGTSFRGIFAGTPGTTMTPVALNQFPAPGGGTYSFVGNADFNAAGKVAFSSVVAMPNFTNLQTVFAGTPGTTLTVVARQGTAAPAGGNYDQFFGNALINAPGNIALYSTLTGGSSTSGIFTGTPGQTLQTIALQGAAAPNGGGATYSLTSSIASIMAFNATGQVAFVSTLAGTGVDSSNNRGLYAGSPGNVVKIVRTGDIIDVDPTAGVDLRTVSAISFMPPIDGSSIVGSGGEDGRRTAFNDFGMLVYRLNFTDNSSGIFTSNITPVPEPGCLLAIAVLGAGVARFVRRRMARG